MSTTAEALCLLAMHHIEEYDDNPENLLTEADRG